MTDITALVQRIKAAAEKATPGEWCCDDRHGVIADAGLNGNFYIASCSGPEHRPNAQFIADTSPANVLALVEALEKAQSKAIQQGNIACVLLDEVTQLRLSADDKAPELRAQLIEADSELEALRQRIAELENDEVRQRLANAEHQLHMAELAKHNLKASRKAQFRKRKVAEQRIVELQSENEYIRKRFKESDLLFGKNILVMQAAIIEWQGTGDAKSGLAWIYNTLFGPGELPDEAEKDAQAYFDRKHAPLDEELMALHKWFWQQSEAERAASVAAKAAGIQVIEGEGQ